LLDEILAVGDIAFQLKCFDRMREIQGSGTTIVLVSHSMHAIRLLCPRAIVMRHGALEFDGSADAAIARHLQILSAEAHATAHPDSETDDQSSVEIVDRVLLGPDGPTNQALQETPMRLRLRLRFERAIDSPVICFTVLAEDGRVAYQLTTAVGGKYRTYAAGDTAEVEIRFTPRLASGTFRLTTVIVSNDHRVVLARDDVGELIFLAPRLGSLGVAELGADVLVDGTLVNYEGELTLGGGLHTEAP
jgi:lipopolysaccharide transport system ATP-binding protein